MHSNKQARHYHRAFRRRLPADIDSEMGEEAPRHENNDANPRHPIEESLSDVNFVVAMRRSGDEEAVERAPSMVELLTRMAKF